MISDLKLSLAVAWVQLLVLSFNSQSGSVNVAQDYEVQRPSALSAMTFKTASASS